jgi:hypothetical protein
MVLFEEEDKILPEYSGRFFVKINRDAAFEENIVNSFPVIKSEYGIKNSFSVLPSKNQGNNDGGQDAVWYDGGNSSSTNNKKPWGNTCPWKYPGECFDKRKWTVMVHGLLHGDRDNPDKWLGGAMADLDNKGTLIRFADANGNTGKIYTIKESNRNFDRRGFRRSNSNYDNPSNGRNAWEITFEEEYSDDKLFTNRLGSNPITEIQILQKVLVDGNKTLSSFNPAIFETEPKESIDINIYYEATGAEPISNFNTTLELEYYNVFSFGNGVESNRIRDDYNEVTIGKGVKASSTLDIPYSEERRGSGFIFSQIYNSTSGINRLNQFIQAEPITKDLNPIYGTIQKLHARDTDLIALCEDKCLRVLANKDALYNADGNVNLTGNNAVLGQAVPYAGEYGISKNPESFADYAFRTYFADKNRGAIIRLSMDGITVISDKGMSDFFADNLRSSNKIIGSYDEDKSLYNITLNNIADDWKEQLSQDKDYNLTAECETPSSATNLITKTTISFKEEVDGWTSRKSFIPENGISLNNIYYTFKSGKIWQNNASAIYNNFYDEQYNSSFNVLINELPQIVKGYSALNYTGTQSRELEYLYNNKWYSIAEVNANQIVPSSVQVKKEGWLVNYIRTNLESGEVKEFENKEGKYFNYIKALEVCKIGNGIGSPTVIDADPINYNLTVTINEECSSANVLIPDAIAPCITFVYQWMKTGTNQIANIVANTTNNSVVCDINDFYDSLQRDYSGIQIWCKQVKYFSSDGFQVGTQLYDYNLLTPEAGPAAYVELTPYLNNAALDPNNPYITIPDTYRIILINSSGIISSITQYNTITCP